MRYLNAGQKYCRMIHNTLKPVLSGFKIRQNKGLKAMWYLNAGQKYYRIIHNTFKPVLSGHSKTDKTQVLKPCGTLMQVKSTAECSTGVEHSAILLTCIKQLSVSKIYFFGLLLSGRLRQVLLYDQSHFFH